MKSFPKFVIMIMRYCKLGVLYSKLLKNLPQKCGTDLSIGELFKQSESRFEITAHVEVKSHAVILPRRKGKAFPAHFFCLRNTSHKAIGDIIRQGFSDGDNAAKTLYTLHKLFIL